MSFLFNIYQNLTNKLSRKNKLDSIIMMNINKVQIQKHLDD